MNQGYKGNFFSFYPSLFTTGTYPKGNLSWHHLWFIAYLFVYDVALAPVFKWVIVNKDKWSVRFLAAGQWIYLLVTAFHVNSLDKEDNYLYDIALTAHAKLLVTGEKALL